VRILHTFFRNGLRNWMKSSRCCPGIQTPQISIQLSIFGKCWTNKFDPWRLHLTTYRTWSAANVLVPETTGESPIEWQHAEDQKHTMQVFVIFWLICVHMYGQWCVLCHRASLLLCLSIEEWRQV